MRGFVARPVKSGHEIDREVAACVRGSLCPYRPRLFSLTYSSTFRRATAGRFGDERIRLMTIAVGPALLSKLSNAQAVLRPTPRTAACLAVVSNPAAINAARISSSFEACFAFACRFFLVPCISVFLASHKKGFRLIKTSVSVWSWRLRPIIGEFVPNRIPLR